MKIKKKLKQKKDILFICINYYNEDDTQKFVYDLIKQKKSNLLHIIIVDNNGNEVSDHRLHNLSKMDSRIQVFNPVDNLGYFGGAAWALKKYLFQSNIPEWIIISNTDISFENTDFILNLLAMYPKEIEAIIAPSIISAKSGMDQNPYMTKRPNKIRMLFRKFIFMYRYTSFIYTYLYTTKLKILSKIERKNSKATSKRIYAPHGSFIIFNKMYFESGGSLNYEPFLFGEEVFIAETARSLGLHVKYEPLLSVLHQEHATTGKKNIMIRYQREASSYCADTFFFSK
ncbi:Glycosyltransferase II domain-containing protein [Desulfonema limicola]|uniref:Glycosyltransferase II domain-containing protein n=1 Tax=Desulfonema limicola TaxID=45656 RepID=A0A975BDE6_9BACT|nr:glycosyltransferase [Desulfonema limicola]QTA83253.1 Glycosyltransferase II domain-containing protein [Desulfonema limicola]